MIFIPRRVQLPSSLSNDQIDHEAFEFEKLRSIPAWILLGEPGAGKSQAFKTEAKQVDDGLCLTVAEFISSDIDESWSDKCLFLDGLDEMRATDASDSILYRVKSQLRKLRTPRFRIACRAADWFGQTDREIIRGVSPNGQLPIYTLVPLTTDDVKRILKENFDRTDADEFINNAKHHGIQSLLRNPQTLELIVKSLRGKNWPSSSDETFELACEKIVQERDRIHLPQRQLRQISTIKLLNAAGMIFAALLLADKSGIALNKDYENSRFIGLSNLELGLTDDELAAALRTALFVPSTSNDQLLVPVHRSVAEYLAANWLGKQINDGCLSLLRVLNLLVGFDGKAVVGLRGLYGWLALKCSRARLNLIKNDPLTVAMYSDPYPMPIESKRVLIKEVFAKIQENHSVFSINSTAHDLSSLYDKELHGEYIAMMRDPNRDDQTQTCVVFTLKVLSAPVDESPLGAEQKEIVMDGTRWPSVRRLALANWIKSGVTDDQIVEVIDQLIQGPISDKNSVLLMDLLDKFYPTVITAKKIVGYINFLLDRTVGWYNHFWIYEFPRRVPEKDLLFVLDQLAQRGKLSKMHWELGNIQRMLLELVDRGLKIYGDTIPDVQLFSWLRLGTNQLGEISRRIEFGNSINQWLNDRPERYKGLLGICFQRSEKDPEPFTGLFHDEAILRNVAAPADIGLWHFTHINQQQNPHLSYDHLKRAVGSLYTDRLGGDLTIDMLEGWAGEDPEKIKKLDKFTKCELTDNEFGEFSFSRESNREQALKKNRRTAYLAERLSQICSGEADPALLFELAGVWGNRFNQWGGDTVRDRFKNYCNNYDSVCQAAETGFSASIRRSDLPSVEEIIELNLQQKSYFISSVCLLGMELIWKQGAEDIDQLYDSILQKMVCFMLADGTLEKSDWFWYVLANRPELVSDVLIAYIGACFKAKVGVDYLFYLFSGDDRFKKVACLSVPTLLRIFPSRNNVVQLKQVNLLLISALKHSMVELPIIVAQKLGLKTISLGQRIYFLLTGAIVDPQKYEQQLWSVVGLSWKRVQFISSFARNCSGELVISELISVGMIGKFIEVLTPYADFSRSNDEIVEVTDARDLRRRIAEFIQQLSVLGSNESLHEINRLLELPALSKIKDDLLYSKFLVTQKVRESTFTYSSLSNVATVLCNQAPVAPVDLQAIVLDFLAQIATDIKTSNSDLFRQFWTEETVGKHKHEGSCRDALLEMLRRYLLPLGIECEPEFDFVSDKSCDIRVSYRNKFIIPIECKGEWHTELWKGVQNQLVPRYAQLKESAGLGIYLVFWVGGSEQPAVRDGGYLPQIPAELERRLQNDLPKEIQKLIAVRVIDVTPP